MGEIDENIARALKYFLYGLIMGLLRHLSPEQKAFILMVAIYIIDAAILAFLVMLLLKASRKLRRKMLSSAGGILGRLRKSEDFRPRLPISVRLSLLCPILLLLFAAVGGGTYNFYVLLRWVVCGTLLYVISKVNKMDNKFWIVVMGVIALLFNPLAPFHFHKDTWELFNLIACLIVATFLLLSRSTPHVTVSSKNVTHP